MGEILKELPAVILRGSVLLPGVVSHFDISTQRSIHAVEAAMNDDNHIFPGDTEGYADRACQTGRCLYCRCCCGDQADCKNAESCSPGNCGIETKGGTGLFL